jgi:hypothetical protein
MGFISRVAMAMDMKITFFGNFLGNGLVVVQNVISDIYRNYSLYTYVISVKYVICKWDGECIQSRDCAICFNRNLPENVQRVVKKTQFIYPYSRRKIMKRW